MTKGIDISERIKTALGIRVSYLTARAKKRSISFYQAEDGKLEVRLHPVFRQLEEKYLDRFIRLLEKIQNSSPENEDKKLKNFLDKYIHPRMNYKKRAARHLAPPPEAGHIDLQGIFDSLNEEYFKGQCRATISWGKRPPRRARSSIRLGVYYYEERLIRISPLLADPRVPGYCLRSVVYHEMAHDILHEEKIGYSGRPHNRAFKNLEAQYSETAKSTAWETLNLEWLLGRTNVVKDLSGSITEEKNMPILEKPLKGELRDLGLLPYNQALEIQLQSVEKVKANRKRPLFLLTEHPAIITLGKSGGKEDLLVSEAYLAEQNIELQETSRGGRATLHAPGQLIAYPIFPLDTLNISLREYLFRLEEALFATLKEFNIQAQRLEGFTGAWIENRKIAAIGVAAKSWISYHGLALNVYTDMNLYKTITPCGISDKAVTSIEKELGSAPEMGNVKQVLVAKIEEIFKLSF